MISTLFQCFLISTFPIYTYFNVILTPGFTDAASGRIPHAHRRAAGPIGPWNSGSDKVVTRAEP